MSFQNREKDTETLDSVFERLSKSSSEEMNEVELEVSNDDTSQEATQTEHAITIGLAKFGSWFVFNNVCLNIKAVLVISIVAAVLIYLIYGLPRIMEDTNGSGKKYLLTTVAVGPQGLINHREFNITALGELENRWLNHEG